MNAPSVPGARTRRKRRATATPRPRTVVRHPRSAPRPHLRLGWYAGIAVMAIVEVIEWPLAILMVLGHEIAHHTHSEALREFAEGVEAGT
jgi:hypothetical protein